LKRVWRRSSLSANSDHFLLALALALPMVSCGSSQPKPQPPPEQASKPAVPPEIQQVAENALGAETDVLLFGDLARNGNQQVLAVNRLKGEESTKKAGTLITRAVVIQNNDGHWRQVLLCDQHLKNEKGYLAGTPLSPVNGWRLETQQDPVKGLTLYFQPLQQPAGGYVITIGVQWNPKVDRYQSLNRTFEHFEGESPQLETPQVQLR
jgi:hypothetical protein